MMIGYQAMVRRGNDLRIWPPNIRECVGTRRGASQPLRHNRLKEPLDTQPSMPGVPGSIPGGRAKSLSRVLEASGLLR